MTDTTHEKLGSLFSLERPSWVLLLVQVLSLRYDDICRRILWDKG